MSEDDWKLLGELAFNAARSQGAIEHGWEVVFYEASLRAKDMAIEAMQSHSADEERK